MLLLLETDGVPSLTAAAWTAQAASAPFAVILITQVERKKDPFNSRI